MRKKNIQKQTIKKLIKHLKSYRLLLLLSLLLAAVTVVLTLYLPILIGQAVDLIIGAGAVDFKGLGLLMVKMAVVIGATSAVQWLMSSLNNRMTYLMVRDIRKEAFERIEKLPLSYLDGHSTGDLLSRIVADIDQLSDGLLMGFTQLFSGVLTIIGTLFFMVSINYKIALIVFILTPISLFVAAFISKRTYSMFKLQSETRGALTAHVDEMIGGQKVVQAFGYEAKAAETFANMNEKLAHYSLRAIFFSSITNPATRFVNSLVYAAAGIAGALSAIAGGISIGQLTSFLSYANQYTKPFNEISEVITELQNALTCAARVFELIEEEIQTPDPVDARVLRKPEGRIDASHVSFAYCEDTPLIKDLNIAVAPGQRIAIVGPTGCGKTTLINLLMRFYDVNGGSISVEATDIRQITRDSLRQNFGMVLQDTWLKSGTIRENIAYGKPEAAEEEIIRAAKEAYAHGFIKRLPHGYDTMITEDGGNLSQGQKQLLCIARVMLCLPPMLILDEATSSIDTRTEIRIQKAFAKLMAGRTSFIVAHRLSTIKEADRILVMRDGDIIEQGKHDELIQAGGFYAELYNSQFARQG